MKGFVFTELTELAERKFGEDAMDTVFDNVELSSGGAYTSVGYYAAEELNTLVVDVLGEFCDERAREGRGVRTLRREEVVLQREGRVLCTVFVRHAPCATLTNATSIGAQESLCRSLAHEGFSPHRHLTPPSPFSMRPQASAHLPLSLPRSGVI